MKFGIKSLILLLLVLSVSCSSYKTKRTVESNGNVSTTDIEVTDDTKPDTVIVNESNDGDFLKVTKFNNFTKDEIAKFWKAANGVKNTLKTKCFGDYIINRKLIQTNNLSNAEVLNVLRGKKPDLSFTMYYSRKNVVGYTYKNSSNIWMNRKFHNNYTAKSKGKNLMHEVSHKLGFGHDFKRTSRRPFSVPYSVGTGIGLCWVD